MIVDEIMGPIITEAFKLYATGLYTLGTLTDELNHLGLRMPETKNLPERPVQTQHVHRILRNPYYTGVVTYNGVAYPGEHDPLVDEPTFDMVQAILTARNLNKDKSKKHPHPLKGNLYCARCGRRLGITTPTNRHGVTYGYFYCLGRQKDRISCDQPYVAIAEVEAAVADYFRCVRMPQGRLTKLRDQIIASFAGREAAGAAAIAGAKARIHKANQRARKNKEAYYADALSLEDFKLEQDKTKADIAAAEKIIAKWSVELDSITTSLDEALSLMIDPYRLFIEAPDHLRLMLTQAVFEKIWIMGPDIAGAELTNTYHELLTLEARLTEQANQEAQRATDSLTIAPAPRTYHRRRMSATSHTSGPDSDNGTWLEIERPSGPLPIDNQSPASTGVRRDSDVDLLVGVAGFEPTAPRSQSECATKLRHTPVHHWCPAQPTRRQGSRVSHRSRPTTKRMPVRLGRRRFGGACGRSSMVEPQPSKLAMRVRFPSPAPRVSAGRRLVVRRLWTFDAGLFSFHAPRVPVMAVTHGLSGGEVGCSDEGVEAIGDGAVALVAGMEVDQGRRWQRRHPRTKLEPGRPAPAVRPEPRHCARPLRAVLSVAARSNEPDPCHVDALPPADPIISVPGRCWPRRRPRR